MRMKHERHGKYSADILKSRSKPSNNIAKKRENYELAANIIEKYYLRIN
jgi:hypothetical protein